MTIEQALVALLGADATLTALISTRLYPQEAPQDDTLPCVLYATSDTHQHETLGGWIDLYDQSFRFDCYGGTGSGGAYASAKAVAAAVRACLFGLGSSTGQGTITSGGESVYVRGISGEGGEDGLEPPVHGEERGIDYVGVQVRVWWAMNG